MMRWRIIFRWSHAHYPPTMMFGETTCKEPCWRLCNDRARRQWTILLLSCYVYLSWQTQYQLVVCIDLYYFISIFVSIPDRNWLSQSCGSRLAWQAFKLRTDSASFALARFSWCFLWGCTVSTVYMYNLLWYRIIDMYILYILQPIVPYIYIYDVFIYNI